MAGYFELRNRPVLASTLVLLLLPLYPSSVLADQAAPEPLRYGQRATQMVGQVDRVGYTAAARQAIAHSLRGGLRIVGHGKPDELSYMNYFHIATHPAGRASKGAVYPELRRKVRIRQRGSLQQKLADRARSIRHLARTIDAPLYHEVEQRFLRDAQGARVLMVGRGTEGFYHWVTAGLLRQGQSGQRRARDFHQLDMATGVLDPLLSYRGPESGRAQVRDQVYGKLVNVLRDAGFDARSLLREGRKLVLLDTGKRGTGPRNIKNALLWDVARTGDADALRRLDALIDVQLIWSKTANWRAAGQLELHNFEQVINKRPVKGYLDEYGGRNVHAINMVDERPHEAHPANAFGRTAGGRHVLHNRPSLNYSTDPACNTPAARQNDMLRRLDSRLFALALSELRARIPADAVLRRDHSAGMVRSRKVRERLKAHPETLSLLRDIYAEELQQARRHTRFGEGDPYANLPALRQVHRMTEMRYCNQVAAPEPAVPRRGGGLWNRLRTRLGGR